MHPQFRSRRLGAPVETLARTLVGALAVPGTWFGAMRGQG